MNTWKLNNTVLYNHRVKYKIIKETRKYLGTNENKNTTYQNLQETTKVVLKRNL